jgi:selenocysteine lyase/cysteine desulfurase
MDFTRRQIAQSATMALLSSGAPRSATRASAQPASDFPLPGSPARSAFAVIENEVCLNNARWHPLSKGSKQAVVDYLDYKARGIWNPPDTVSRAQESVKASFAKLINADASEIAFVNSTTAGENLFVASLDLLASGGNVVTDALHFEGSLYFYEALKQRGVDVRVVQPRGWKIVTEDLEKVVNKETRLVAISQVSFINGFQHNVKQICDLAHAHGALVYVDAVQAAGAVPIDVRAWDVDAMGCASYKWLMGDMGLGFLYVRKDVLPRLRQTSFGYRQLSDFAYHAFPWDQPGTYPVSWKQRDGAAGMFEIGTVSNSTLAALTYSLSYIHALGVERIQAHAQTLITRLQDELPRLGYQSITPRDTLSPIATFLVANQEKTKRALRTAKVDVSMNPGRMRISPSIYNVRDDIEALLSALD